MLLLSLLRPRYSSSGVIPPILETPELELEPRCVVIFCGKQDDLFKDVNGNLKENICQIQVGHKEELHYIRLDQAH
jgi:hypothetical protein